MDHCRRVEKRRRAYLPEDSCCIEEFSRMTSLECWSQYVGRPTRNEQVNSTALSNSTASADSNGLEARKAINSSGQELEKASHFPTSSTPSVLSSTVKKTRLLIELISFR